MARSIVFVILSLTVIGPALADTTSSTPAPPYVHESCVSINNVSAIVKTTVYEFVGALSQCAIVDENDRGNMTVEAVVLMDVFGKLNNGRTQLGHLFDYPQLTDKVVACIQGITGHNINGTYARQHFGVPNTLSLQFKAQQCLLTSKLAQCVDDVYDKAVKDEHTKVHRKVFASVFGEIGLHCESVLVRDDRNNGQKFQPSYTTLTSSIAGMLCTLVILN